MLSIHTWKKTQVLIEKAKTKLSDRTLVGRAVHSRQRQVHPKHVLKIHRMGRINIYRKSNSSKIILIELRIGRENLVRILCRSSYIILDATDIKTSGWFVSYSCFLSPFDD